MAGLCGDSPDDVFLTFKNHLNRLLNRTVTQAPLTKLLVPPRVLLQFWQDGRPVCVRVGRGYHLYVGQTLEAIKEAKSRYRLRTVAYAYRIAEGPSFDDRCLFRWEYKAREFEDSLFPRHHLHLPVMLRCAGHRTLDAEALHIPTGWITVEEVVRFLIHELGVRPRSRNWDALLRESEQKFREWTGREI